MYFPRPITFDGSQRIRGSRQRHCTRAVAVPNKSPGHRSSVQRRSTALSGAGAGGGMPFNMPARAGSPSAQQQLPDAGNPCPHQPVGHCFASLVPKELLGTDFPLPPPPRPPCTRRKRLPPCSRSSADAGTSCSTARHTTDAHGNLSPCRRLQAQAVNAFVHARHAPCPANPQIDDAKRCDVVWVRGLGQVQASRYKQREAVVQTAVRSRSIPPPLSPPTRTHAHTCSVRISNIECGLAGRWLCRTRRSASSSDTCMHTPHSHIHAPCVATARSVAELRCVPRQPRHRLSCPSAPATSPLIHRGTLQRDHQLVIRPSHSNTQALMRSVALLTCRGTRLIPRVQLPMQQAPRVPSHLLHGRVILVHVLLRHLRLILDPHDRGRRRRRPVVVRHEQAVRPLRRRGAARARGVLPRVGRRQRPCVLAKDAHKACGQSRNAVRWCMSRCRAEPGSTRWVQGTRGFKTGVDV